MKCFFFFLIGFLKEKRMQDRSNRQGLDRGVGLVDLFRNSSFSGAASSLVTTLITFPIYKTTFRQQLHALVIREALKQLYKEGPLKFYRGVLPPMLAKTVQGTVLFGTYETALHWLSSRSDGRSQSILLCCISGFFSGTIEALILAPFERVQNILQDSRKDSKLPNVRRILQQFNSCSGYQVLTNGYYRGFLPTVLRNGVGSAMFFSSKDPIRDHLTQRGLSAHVSSFVSGSVNSIVISLLLYPLSVLIVNMQSQVGGEVRNLKDSITAVWRSRQSRVHLIYRGVLLVILRSCITWGLTTTILFKTLLLKIGSKKEMEMNGIFDE
uniref:Solute carrier family 25 member 53 n=1 Tax=Erpetoichthys calabaricus TaxID=27687 RepID=A0A8C4SK41_ERPCA